MKNFTIIVDEASHKQRLDKFLSSKIPEFSRSKIKNLIEEKAVTINGKGAENASHKVLENDEIHIELPEVKPTEIRPKHDIEIDIIYEDDDLMIVNKQAGLTVHPGAGNFDDTLVNALVAKMGENLSSMNGVERPGIVHRLDRDTTGLLMIAKNDKSHRRLSKMIQEREVKRIYHALVWNSHNLKIGTININIGRNRNDRTKMSVFKSFGKNAITNFEVLKTYFNGALSLLEVSLETGRTHQIRVHMEHKKMPLVGDKTYKGQDNYKKHGSIEGDDLRQNILNFGRQALHAKKLALYHPITEDELEFEAPYPNDMQNVINRLEDFVDK